MSMADSPSTVDCPNIVGLKRSRCDDDKTASSSSSSSDSSWKTMYEAEHTKNTMLNLQLCFVQSECMRLLNLQSDMAGSIATLQNSLASWIEDVGSDDESDSEDDGTEEATNDSDTPPLTSDDTMSGSGTDEEDQVPKRPRNPVIVHKHPRTNPCTTITQ